MAKRPIGIRMDEDRLRVLDWFCEAQEVPLDRTRVIETALWKFLEEKLGGDPFEVYRKAAAAERAKDKGKEKAG